MEEIDMRPGTELFPESSNTNYNSMNTDENIGHVVDDPLNTGAIQPDAAGQEQMSEQRGNFRALREEISKMKEEREYWKGQAEAYSRQPARQPETTPVRQEDAFSALDWDDSRDVRKAFEAMRQENASLRNEIKDAFTAMDTKSRRQNWDSMVTQHVPQLTKENPIFAEMIQKASNPYEAAYLLAELKARGANQAAQNIPSQAEINAQRMMMNAQKPQSLASVGGKGQLSSADYYASMSDEDFMKIAAKNLANI